MRVLARTVPALLFFVAPATTVAQLRTSLVEGQRIRIWTADARFPADIHAIWGNDSLRVERTDIHWAPDSIRLVTLTPAEIERIDRASGTRAGRGVLYGLAASAVIGIVYGAAIYEPRELPSWFVSAGVAAATTIFTVPLGALIGSFQNGWEPVPGFGEQPGRLRF